MAALSTLTGTNPAANAELSQTVPAGEVWKVQAIRFTLVTSATVATRTVNLTIDDGTNQVWRSIAPATQTASLTRQYLWMAGITSDAGFDANNDIKLALPVNFPMAAGWRIRTQTTNLSSGDDFGAPLIHYVVARYNDEMDLVL